MSDAGITVHVTLFDFYDPNVRIEPAKHHGTRWVPLGHAGYSWGLFSWRGKLLAYIFRDSGIWWAIKTCCDDLRECAGQRSAALYAQTVTHCVECKLSHIPAGLN